MKFYIFGNTVKDSEICCSATKAAFISDDLEVSIDKFKDYINEVRFTNCYLVVDFETSKKNVPIGVVTIENDHEKIMPFFIIGEWHIGESKDEFIRVDHTILTKNGFIHEFMNNVDVIRDMIYCLNNHIQFTLEITYFKEAITFGHKEIQEIRRLIVYSVDIIRGRGYSIKKFKIKPVSWKVVPISRIFRLYKLEKISINEPVTELQLFGN
jgi:hypothetical protein